MRAPSPRWELAVGLGACAIAGACVALGRIHEAVNSDYLMSVLNSRMQWTFHYWEQDRFGMLSSLLALPLRGWLADLLFQRALYVGAGFAAFVLVARYLGQNRSWLVQGLAAAASFLLLARLDLQVDYLGAQPFGLALALGAGGLIALSPEAGSLSVARWLGGLTLLLLAHWVNLGAILTLGPLLTLHEVWARRRSHPQEPWEVRRRRVALALGALLLAALGSWLTTRFSPHRGTSLNPGSLTGWPAAWATGLAWNAEVLAGPHALGLAALGLLGALPLARATARARWAAALAPPLVALATAAFAFLATSTFRHVQENGNHWRYTEPSLALLHLALGAGPLWWLEPGAFRSSRRRWPVSAMLCAALWLACLFRFGVPSLSRVRQTLDARLGEATAELLDAKVTHVAGTYWTVWRWVFHANWTLEERGEPTRIYGLSHRSWATYGQWMEVPVERTRIAVPRGEETEAQRWLETYGYRSLEKVDERGCCLIYRTLSPPAPQ